MLKFITECFTVYKTYHHLRINSVVLSVSRILVVVLVWIAYLFSINFNLKNIYQRSCPVESAVTIKLKGSLSTQDVGDSEFAVSNPNLYRRVWDADDLVFPPYGGADGSFVVATNLIITPNQTLGTCPEARPTPAVCQVDADCSRLPQVDDRQLDGVLTGKCNKELGTCELAAWCPVESSTLPLKNGQALLEGVKDFTVFVKNSVEFPDCGKSLRYRNMLPSFTLQYLENCYHDKEVDDMCPIIRLGDIVKWSGFNFSEVAKMGAVFKIGLRWECDFDTEKETCFPKYQFERLDKSNDVGLATGFNFRIPYYYAERRRALDKMYGIKFIVIVSGEGKKFDFLNLVLALGATIALFDLAPVICDNLFHLLCYLKRFSPFKKHFSDFSHKSRYVNMNQNDTTE